MRILWYSNSPRVPSGYGQQTARITPALRDLGHEVYIRTNHGPSDESDYRGIPVFTRQGPNFHGLADLLTSLRPHLLVLLADPWVIDANRLQEVLLSSVDTELAVWDPIDTEPLSAPDVPLLELAHHILAMSPHGVEMLDRAGFECTYIPHVIPDGVYKPKPTLANDPPIIGAVLANQGTRKLIHLHLEALAIARETLGDLMAYFHTDLSGQSLPFGVDYRGVVQYFGLSGTVYDQGESQREEPLDDTEMSSLYNRFDLLLNCSAGEGFGVPVIEAQACGTHVVTTRNSAMRDLNPFGYQVDPVIKEYVPDKMAFYSWPTPDDIAERICAHFRRHAGGINKSMVDFAREFEVSRVAKHHWKPFLNRIRDRIAA